MAGKRTSKTDKTDTDDATAESKPGNWLTRWLFRPRILLLFAVAATSITFAPTLRNLIPDLSQRDEYRLSADRIHISPPPRWVPDDLVEQVLGGSQWPKTTSLLDDALTAKVAEAFRQHPWVAEVLTVRKSVPAHIDVQLEYRQPVGMIRVKQGMYPVDKDGILLPPADFSVADTQRYPTIDSVRSIPQGPAGTSWGDTSVLGAARLAKVLAPHWKKFDLVSIRVPRVTTANATTEQLVYTLISRGGSQIVWGRAPGTTHPGELSAEQKVAKLNDYLRDFGRFDQPHGPYEIDIRHWQETSRQPLSAGRDRPPAR